MKLEVELRNFENALSKSVAQEQLGQLKKIKGYLCGFNPAS
jgi:hypothetical protein